MSAVRRCTWPMVTPGSIGFGARCVGTMVPWSWLWSDALAMPGSVRRSPRAGWPGATPPCGRVRATAIGQTGHMAETSAAPWPALPYEEWRATKETLHRFAQIVGKVRMALVPFRNHWWHVTLYV